MESLVQEKLMPDDATTGLHARDRTRSLPVCGPYPFRVRGL
jgi:hypothetical protein